MNAYVAITDHDLFRHDLADDFPELPDIPGGYAPTAPGHRRIGQGIFQSLILDAYGRQCAVTRERALPALDAAHIRSFSERPEHDVLGRTPAALGRPPPVRHRLCHRHPAVCSG